MIGFFSTREPWMVDAACLDHHPELWFSDNKNAAVMAKEICAGCPSLQPCLQWAIETNERWGIFGGQTYAERVNLRRRANYRASQEESDAA